jgi:glycosyltransferase involved in cell wall biosynthesis
MWSRYKAVVFAELYRLAEARGEKVRIYQIAETESDRVSLSNVEADWHKYPFTLLFKGSYSDIPKPRLIWALGRKALTTDVDLTILAGYNQVEYWIQALILKARRKRFAFFCDSTINDNPQTPFKAALKRIFFGLADGAFCYGDRSYTYLLHYGMAPHKIYSRRQAAALPADYDAHSIPQRRAAARATSGKFRCLYVGRLSPEKRIDTLIKSFQEVRDQDPQAELIIIGKGPQEGKLKSLVQNLDLSSNVQFLGSRSGDALFQEYLAASCLVLPSWSEPWGLVVNEALHFGCPVVVSDRCGCVPELVDKGDAGYVFQCESVEELSDRLQQISSSNVDPEKTAKICLAKIKPFTPNNAANEIISGSISLISK